MAKIMDASEVFHLRIKTLYDIEKQLEKSLPKMAKAVTNYKLETALRAHIEETKEQSNRLELIFDMLDVTRKKFRGESIRGLVADGNALATLDAPDYLRDVLIAGAGRNVEHFEISNYMSAIEEAKGLGHTDAVALLEATLAEEVAADEKLEMALKENLTLAADEEENEDE